MPYSLSVGEKAATDPLCVIAFKLIDLRPVDYHESPSSLLRRSSSFVIVPPFFGRYSRMHSPLLESLEHESERTSRLWPDALDGAQPMRTYWLRWLLLT